MSAPAIRSHPSAWWVLLGLVAGAALGVASRTGVPGLASLVSVVEPIGILFVNAIRMTVVPLVVAMLIAGIGTAPDLGMLPRLGLRSLVIGLTLAFVVAGSTMLVAVPVLARLPIDPAAATALREAAGVVVPAEPTGGIGRWLTDLVPVNVVKAAADGGLLPLILFALAFGFALTRVAPDRRAAVTAFFSGLADAMMVLVGWIIRAAPLGVFGLTAPLGARLGGDLAGALVSYVGLAVGLTVAALAGRYGCSPRHRRHCASLGVGLTRAGVWTTFSASLENTGSCPWAAH